MEVINRGGDLAQTGRMVITPHPLTLQDQRILASDLVPGESLLSFLGRHIRDLDSGDWAVSIGGRDVPMLMWERTHPKHGMLIECRRAVRGDILKIAAIIVISYFTLGAGGLAAGGLFAAGGAIGGGILAAGAVFIAGTLLVNQLLGPKQADPSQLSVTEVSPTYSLSGGNNTARPYEPIALLFGELRVTPDFSSVPFSWFQGDDQYLGIVLHGGINCASVRDLRVGKNSIENYTDVSLQADGFSGMAETALQTWSNVDSVAGAALPGGLPGDWVVRTTSAATVAIQVDIEGTLYQVDEDGVVVGNGTRIEGDFRLLPGGDWTFFLSEPVIHDSTKPLRLSYKTNLPVEGQYEVRMRKFSTDTSLSNASSSLNWASLKSVQNDTGFYVGIGRMGMQIKASGQLSGTLDTINWVATAKPIPVWNGVTWIVSASPADGLSNPGANILQYVRGYYAEDGSLIAGMGLDDSMIDIESLQGFMVRCSQRQFRFDWWLDSTMSHDEVLKNIAAAGMASYTWAKGKIGVVWFAEDEPIGGVVNMATMKPGSFRVNYATLDTADGLEYQYYDRDRDYSWQPLRVQDPGIVTSLNPAKVTSVGITYADHAALLSRFILGQNLYQRKTITYDTDLEHLTYQRGSILALTHDVTQWGYGGRVASAIVMDGLCTLTLDDTLPAGGGGFVGLRVPGEMGYRIFRVATLVEDSRIITLVGSWPTGVDFPGADGNPAHDTLWVYDFKSTPGYKVRITSIEPQANMEGATVTCVPEGNEFWDYVLNGSYAPAPNSSGIGTAPVASRLQITEELQRQGASFSVKLTATFDVVGRFDHAQVWGSKGGTAQKIGETQNRRFDFDAGLDDVWTIEIRPYDGVGRLGGTVQASYAVVGLRFPPEDVISFAVDADGVATWSAVPAVDLAGYELRWQPGNNRSWGDASPLHVGLITEAPYNVMIRPSGPATFMIKALDTTGNESINPAISVTNLGDPLVANVITSYDYRANGWPGTYSGALIVGGDLVAREDASPAGWDADPNTNAWTLDTDPGWSLITYTPLAYLTPAYIVAIADAGAQLTLKNTIAGTSHLIEFRRDGDAPGWTSDSEPGWTDDAELAWQLENWRPWPGSVSAVPGRYEWQVSIQSRDVRGGISQLVAQLDVRDQFEVAGLVAVLAAGTVVPTTKTWRQITSIGLTLVADGGASETARIENRAARLITTRNGANAAVNGHVLATLQGY